MFISNIFLSGRKRPEVNQIKIRAVRSGATEALNTVLEQALKIPIHMYILTPSSRRYFIYLSDF